jgi:preprotein translocase subunit SecG
MFTLLIVLAIIVSVLLILIVLIQNPKGGGVAANFSAANQIAGVKKTNDFIEKATWTLAIALFVFSLGSRYVYNSEVQVDNEFLDRVENATPAAPQNLGSPEQAPATQITPEGDATLDATSTPDAAAPATQDQP